VAPSLVTYNTVISACAKAGLWPDARRLADEMAEAGIAPDVFTLCALVRRPARARRAPGARPLPAPCMAAAAAVAGAPHGWRCWTGALSPLRCARASFWWRLFHGGRLLCAVRLGGCGKCLREFATSDRVTRLAAAQTPAGCAATAGGASRAGGSGGWRRRMARGGGGDRALPRRRRRAQRRRLQRPGARPPAPTNGLLLHAGVPNAAAYNALARARPLPRMGCFCMRACPTPPRTTPWRAPASCNECAASSCDVPRDAVMDSCVQCSGAQALALALGLLCHAMWPKMLSRSARPPARVRAGQARRRDRSPGCPRAPATPPLPAPMSRRMPGRVCAGQQPNGSLARDCT
jgi:pentatricopeptide repeat protein